MESNNGVLTLPRPQPEFIQVDYHQAREGKREAPMVLGQGNYMSPGDPAVDSKGQ